MKFNERQTEGLARVSDNLMTSSIIGVVLGLTGHSVITITEISILLVASLVLFWYSVLLRR